VAGGPGYPGIPGRPREPRGPGRRDRLGRLFGITGAGLGALLGSEVITIAALLLYLYVAEPLPSRISALGSWTAYLPGVAADGLTQASQAGVRLLPPWQGGLVFAAWGAVIACVGAAVTARRDIA
jgi:ABC-2 type transport system permease protein